MHDMERVILVDRYGSFGVDPATGGSSKNLGGNGTPPCPVEAICGVRVGPSGEEEDFQGRR